MNEITLNLIVLAVLLVVGGVIFLFVRRKQAQTEKELIKLAEQNGWKFESVRQPLKWGIRLSTSEWTLEALSMSSGRESESGSSNISMSTIWHADSPGSTLLIGDAPRRQTWVDLEICWCARPYRWHWAQTPMA